MGLFATIKNIFSRNNKTPEIASSSILGYDTSLVHIPEFKHLTEEEQEAVNRYIQEEKLESYEDIIKYGEKLQQKSKTITDLLLNQLYRTTEEISLDKLRNMPLNDVIKSRMNTLITQKQLEMYQGVLESLCKESRLRTVALEEIRKKRKTRFTLTFSKADRIKKQEEERQIEQAIERMKITIKIIEQQIQAVLNARMNSRNNRTSIRYI